MRVVPLLLTLAGLSVAGSAHAASLRCAGRLVTVGDTEFELRAKCGAPAHVAVQPRLQSVGQFGREGAAVVATTRELVETWTYLPREGGLGRLVTLRRGRVVAIQAVAGMRLDPDPSCRELSRGATVGEAELSCGPPVDKSAWEESFFVRDPRGFAVQQLRTRERWVYDPGPGRLLRVLEFVNGRLVRISSGRRSP